MRWEPDNRYRYFVRTFSGDYYITKDKSNDEPRHLCYYGKKCISPDYFTDLGKAKKFCHDHAIQSAKN